MRRVSGFNKLRDQQATHATGRSKGDPKRKVLRPQLRRDEKDPGYVCALHRACRGKFALRGERCHVLAVAEALEILGNFGSVTI